MRIQDFNEFYKVVIGECINEIKQYAKDSGYVNLECFRENKNESKVSISIYRNYQKKRDYIKYNYMSKKNPVALDRHKVAACMVYAILKSGPIKVNMWISNLPEKIVLANEYLAFYVALNIIEMYNLDEFNDGSINTDYQIMVPKTYHEDENPQNTYESNLCKAWHYIKIDEIEKFDALGYANVFFLLEKYTDTYLILKEEKSRETESHEETDL